MILFLSWAAYWTCTALFTVSYYLFLYFYFFRKDFTSRSLRSIPKDDVVVVEETVVPIPPFEPGMHSPSTDTEEGAMYHAMDEINAFFEAQKRSKAVKGEVLFALQQILQKYPALQLSGYKISLSHLIKTQCQHCCSLSLSDEEVKGVWAG